MFGGFGSGEGEGKGEGEGDGEGDGDGEGGADRENASTCGPNHPLVSRVTSGAGSSRCAAGHLIEGWADDCHVYR